VTVDDPPGRIAWFENPGDGSTPWPRHDISRRKRGMYDQWLLRDLDGDGDLDAVGTRGNSEPYDGVNWLEKVRQAEPHPVFEQARAIDSQQTPPPSTAPQQIAEHGPGDRSSGSGFGSGYSLRRTSPLPMPPPTQRLVTPSVACRRRSWWTMSTTWRAPVQPTG